MSELRVLVLGGGSWGTTVAHLAAHNGPTTLWARDPETVAGVNRDHRNRRYLPDHPLHPSLVATDDLVAAVADTDVLVMGVPTGAFRSTCETIADHLRPWVPVVSLAKGFEPETRLRMTEIAEEVLPGRPVGVLSGPNLAKEIMAGQPAGAVVALSEQHIARRLQTVFSTPTFRVFIHHDVVGCELGGALKNVYAIAAGTTEGRKLGDNARSALITRGLAELIDLGSKMGGEPLTLAGLGRHGRSAGHLHQPPEPQLERGPQAGRGHDDRRGTGRDGPGGRRGEGGQGGSGSGPGAQCVHADRRAGVRHVLGGQDARLRPGGTAPGSAGPRIAQSIGSAGSAVWLRSVSSVSMPIDRSRSPDQSPGRPPDQRSSRAPGLLVGPRSVERPADAGSTLVGGLETAVGARVDGGGAIHPPGTGWTLDWWIGADDRWYLPAREPSVRQRRIGYGPIVETSVRIPSGDAVATVYPVVAGGGTLTVVEVVNQSPVPVVLALAVRPHDLAGRLQGDGPDVALVDGALRIDGAAGVLLPRPPGSFGCSTTTDLLSVVEAGGDPADGGGQASVAANAVALYPLPHRTSLRFAVPEPRLAATVDPATLRVGTLADADSSARGWTTVVERGGRFEYPDDGVTGLAGAARSRVLLAAADVPALVESLHPGAAPLITALAIGGHTVEAERGLDAVARSFPTGLDHGAAPTADLVTAVATAVELRDEASPIDELLESLAQLTHLVERAGDDQGAETARAGLARLLRLDGQDDAAAHLVGRDLGGGRPRVFRRRHRTRGRPNSPAPSAAAPLDLADLTAMVEAAAPARRWADDDPVVAARYWVAARDHLLCDVESGGTVELVPGFPTAWRGGSVEVHRAPTRVGRVSFAIRWHGFRPALLWEVEPGPHRHGPATLICPALDPDWSTTEPTGEALLAGVADVLPPAPAPGDSFS